MISNRHTIHVYGDARALGLAKLPGEPVNRFRPQLKGLENGGIVASRRAGRPGYTT